MPVAISQGPNSQVYKLINTKVNCWGWVNPQVKEISINHPFFLNHLPGLPALTVAVLADRSPLSRGKSFQISTRRGELSSARVFPLAPFCPSGVGKVESSVTVARSVARRGGKCTALWPHGVLVPYRFVLLCETLTIELLPGH